MKSLLKDCLITRVENSASAAQTALDSDILDMAGWDGVVFIAALGDVTSGSVLTLVAQQNTANSTSGMATLSGASTTFTAGASDADNKLMIVDVFKPQERYVRAYLTRTTQNAVVDGVFAIQYRGIAAPVTQGSTVLGSALAVSPVEA